MNVFDLSAKIAMDINGYLKGMDMAQATAISTVSVIGGQLDKFMSSSIEVGKEFNSTMGQVSATLGKTTDEVGQDVATTDTQFGEFTGTLREFAQYLGENTAFSAIQCGQALNYMALAGYDTQKSMEMLPNVLNLAAAGSMDLARASDMVTDTQTAFGLSSTRTKKMVDEMAKAASTGNTSVEQLGDAFLRIGPLARNLNDGFVTLADGTRVQTDGTQELETALVAMANAGIKGSEAGTHMRNMLMKLTGPTDEGAQTLKKMGVEVFDLNGKMKPLSEVFGDLNKAMANMSQQDRIKVIQDLFNARDLASAESLLSAISGDWDRIGAAIQEADGSAAQMAETKLDNLAGDITLFNSALEGLQIKISDSAMPALRDFTQFGTEAIGMLTDAFSALPDSVQTFVGVTLTAIGKIGSQLPSIMGMMGSLSQMREAAILAGDASGGLAGKVLGAVPYVAGAAAVVGGVVAVATESHKQVTDAIKDAIDINKEAEETKETLIKQRDEIAKWYVSEDKWSDADEKAAYAAQAYADAYQSKITKQKEYNDTLEKYNKLSKTTKLSGGGEVRSDEWWAEYDRISSEFTGLAAFGNFLSAGGMAMGAVDEEVDELSGALEKQSEILKIANDELDARQNSMAIYTSLSREMTEVQRENTEAIYNSFNVLQASPEAVTELVSSIDAINTAYNTNTAIIQADIDAITQKERELAEETKAAQQAAKEQLDSMGGVFDELKLEVSHTVTEITGNLDSQRKYFEDYAENLTWMLGQEFPQSLQAFLTSGTEDAVETLAILKTSSTEDVKKFVDSWNQTEKIKEQVGDTMGFVQTNFAERSKELLDEKDQLVQKMWAEKEAYDAAIADMNSFMDGIKDQQDPTVDVSETLIEAAASALDQYDMFSSAGKHSILGLVDVFTSKHQMHEDYMLGYNTAKQIQKGYKAADDSNSPSKVYMQFAKNALDGLAIGAESNIDEVEDAYQRVAESAQNAYNTALGTNPFEVYENPTYGENTGNTRLVVAGDMRIEISGVDGKTADEIVDVIEERIYENARKEQLDYGLA